MSSSQYTANKFSVLVTLIMVTALTLFSSAVSAVAPVVTSISPANPSPSNATSVDFTVVFDQDVTGVDISDFIITAPTLTGPVVTAVSGSLTTHTVTVNTGTGDGDLRLDVVDDNTIINGTSEALGGVALNDGDFTAGTSYTIDKTAPVPTLALLEPVSRNTSFRIALELDEAVTGVDNADFNVTNGSASGTILFVGFDYYTTILPVSEGLVLISVPAGSFFDEAGNPNPASNSVISFYDLTNPDINITGTVPDPVTQEFTVNLSSTEDIYNLDLSDIVVNNGTASNFVRVNSLLSTALITPTSDGIVTVSVPVGVAQDLAENLNNPSNNYMQSVDFQNPSILSTNPPDYAFPGSITQIQVTFTEPVTGVTPADLTLSAGVNPSSVIGSGAGPYTFSGLSTPATGEIVVTYDGTAVQDVTGKFGSVETWRYNPNGIPAVNVTIDSVSLNDGDLTNDYPIQLRVIFSQNVTDFAADDILTLNGTVSNVTGSGTIYFFDFTPNADGPVSATVRQGAIVAPTPGETNFASNTFNLISDRTPPTLVEFRTLQQYKAGGSIAGVARTTDANGIAEMDLYISVYGGPFVFVSMIDLATESFNYTPNGDGAFRFRLTAYDNAGNEITYPNIPFIPYNDIPNSPFRHVITTTNTPYLFPMTDSTYVQISFTLGSTTSPVIEVERFTGPVAPPGFDETKIINESINITGELLSGSAFIDWTVNPLSTLFLDGPITAATQFETGTNNQVKYYPLGGQLFITGNNYRLVNVPSFSDFYIGNFTASESEWEKFD